MLNWGGHHNGYDEPAASSSGAPGASAAANLSASYNADTRNHMGGGGGGGGGAQFGGVGGGLGGGYGGYSPHMEHLNNINGNTERMVWSPEETFQMTPEEHVAWIGMGDQEKKKLERKRARNRQAASKCRQKKMDRIKELEEQVTNEKHRGQRLDVELTELQRALDNFRRVVDRHAHGGCATQSIRV